MYQGRLFLLSLRYAEANFSHVYILSAKYGLLRLDQPIAPYEETLKTKTKQQKKEWAERVKKSLVELGIIEEEITFLCGEDYCEALPKGKRPMKGLPLGKQLQWLATQTKSRKGIF